MDEISLGSEEGVRSGVGGQGARKARPLPQARERGAMSPQHLVAPECSVLLEAGSSGWEGALEAQGLAG